MVYYKVAIGSDHAGYEYKERIKELDLCFVDYGTHSTESADYSDFAHSVAEAVEKREVNFGILICGSGNGVAMTANKHAVRASVCWTPEIARLARLHGDAEILCLPARFMSIEEALKAVEIFLNTEFEGGRHKERIRKIHA